MPKSAQFLMFSMAKAFNFHLTVVTTASEALRFLFNDILLVEKIGGEKENYSPAGNNNVVGGH